MFKLISRIAAIFSPANRRDRNPPVEEVTLDIADTLEEISRQVHSEAKGKISIRDDDFFSPTHVLKLEAPVLKVTPKKAVKRRLLRPDQYDSIIENSLSALDMSCQIIDRNRAITSRLIRVQVK
jgi:hypothetical protein